MAFCTARFIARRKATRRSSWLAMFSATSLASISGLRISTMFRLTPRRRSSSTSSCAQLLDVGALLADHHARTGGVDRHPSAPLGRPLDDDAADPGLLPASWSRISRILQILVQLVGIASLVGEPARIPGPVDADTAGRSD